MTSDEADEIIERLRSGERLERLRRDLGNVGHTELTISRCGDEFTVCDDTIYRAPSDEPFVRNLDQWKPEAVKTVLRSLDYGRVRHALVRDEASPRAAEPASPAAEAAGGSCEAVLERLIAGECYLTSDGCTSMNDCDQYIFWHGDTGFHVFWNREHHRPQRLSRHDRVGMEALLRLGYSYVPGERVRPGAALPAPVVAASAAHAAARDRIVSQLQQDRTTWLPLPQYEPWGEHLWYSPSGVWLGLQTQDRTIRGRDDALAMERLDRALMQRPDLGPTPADATLVNAAVEADVAVQRAERAMAKGSMLIVDSRAAWGTRVILREGGKTYHVAINDGRGVSNSLRPVHRAELFDSVQREGGVLQPTPPRAREDVRAFLQQPPFAPSRSTAG